MNLEAFAALGRPSLSAIGCLPYMEKWFARSSRYRSWFYGNMPERVRLALGDWHPDETATRVFVGYWRIVLSRNNASGATDLISHHTFRPPRHSFDVLNGTSGRTA